MWRWHLGYSSILLKLITPFGIRSRTRYTTVMVGNMVMERIPRQSTTMERTMATQTLGAHMEYSKAGDMLNMVVTASTQSMAATIMIEQLETVKF